MKIRPILCLLMFLSLMTAANVVAQETTDAAQKADNLRMQLVELEAKGTELQTRSQQLDEALTPENIERALAGVGSTRPEELRAARRRLLQIEKDGVTAQLASLAESRARLESALAAAETQAYHESALQPMLRAQLSVIPRWLIGMFVGLVILVGIVTLIAVRRRSVTFLT